MTKNCKEKFRQKVLFEDLPRVTVTMKVPTCPRPLTNLEKWNTGKHSRSTCYKQTIKQGQIKLYTLA